MKLTHTGIFNTKKDGEIAPRLLLLMKSKCQQKVSTKLMKVATTYNKRTSRNVEITTVCDRSRYLNFGIRHNSDSEGHRFESCRAYILKAL